MNLRCLSETHRYRGHCRKMESHIKLPVLTNGDFDVHRIHIPRRGLLQVFDEPLAKLLCSQNRHLFS